MRPLNKVKYSKPKISENIYKLHQENTPFEIILKINQGSTGRTHKYLSSSLS